jgi:ATP-dependent exoDNAse (exonuclease V) alpha subunit
MFDIIRDTVHRLLKLFIKEDLKDKDLKELRENLDGVKLIVIDEASMLGTTQVERLDRNLRNASKNDKVWGG